MPLRLFLILALLVQQLALPVAMAGGQAAACEAGSCCEVVETTTCCGTVVREMRCGKTGGECLCGVQPADSEPAPEAPRPTDRSDLGPIFIATLGSVIDLPTPPRSASERTLPVVRRRSHNEIQALLCVWRT